MVDGEHDAVEGTARIGKGVDRLRALLVAAAAADARASGGPEFPARVAARTEAVLIDSCHSVVVLDVARQRFRRVPKGVDLAVPFPASEWRGYFRFELDSGTGGFTLVLNEDHTELFRSWAHVGDPCRHCADHRDDGTSPFEPRAE